MVHHALRPRFPAKVAESRAQKPPKQAAQTMTRMLLTLGLLRAQGRGLGRGGRHRRTKAARAAKI